MSWSLSVTNVTADEAEDKLTEELDKLAAVETGGLPNQFASDEAREQATAAIAAAVDLIDSDVVGDGGTTKNPGKRFNVYLSGHANPGHNAADGMANDFVQINVNQNTTPPLV